MEEAQVWSGGRRNDKGKDTAEEMGVGVAAQGQETGWSGVRDWKSQSGGNAFIPQICSSIHKVPSTEEAFQQQKDWKIKSDDGRLPTPLLRSCPRCQVTGSTEPNRDPSSAGCAFATLDSEDENPSFLAVMPGEQVPL